MFGDRSPGQVGLARPPSEQLCGGGHRGHHFPSRRYRSGVRAASCRRDRVLVKAGRPGGGVLRLETVVRCQQRLAGAGFGCAEVVNDPSRTDGVVAIAQQQLQRSPTGSPHSLDPAARCRLRASLMPLPGAKMPRHARRCRAMWRTVSRVHDVAHEGCHRYLLCLGKDLSRA